MTLDMLGFLNNKEQLMHYLARENIVPVKAPPWADHSFELRRNEKTVRGQIGRHLLGKETTAFVLEHLGVGDEQSCKEVREHIKWIRNH